MPATKRIQPRRVKSFKETNRESRLNPASLRRLFFDLVVTEFEHSCAKAAQALAGDLRGADQKRKHRHLFTAETIYRVLRDDQTISYNQLDAIALHYDVPMALILLFSRMRSEVDESGSTASAERVLRGFAAALEAFGEALHAPSGSAPSAYDLLSVETFNAVRKAYLAGVDQTQPTLFSTLPTSR